MNKQNRTLPGQSEVQELPTNTVTSSSSPESGRKMQSRHNRPHGLTISCLCFKDTCVHRVNSQQFCKPAHEF
jgi:hypothetical protein